jgi:hypothetical protein
VGDAVRVPHGVLHRDGAALGQTHEREAVETDGVHHELEVLDPGVQAEVGDLPVGQPAPPLVVPHEPA